MLLLAQTDVGDLGAFFAGFFIVGILFLILGIVTVVASWILFEKAGRNGWEALVPYHNLWVGLGIAGRPQIWVLFFIFGFFLNIIPFLGPLLYFIGAVAFAIVVGIDFAKSFGRSQGFGVGIGLLPFVFLPILAFTNPQYYGPAGPEGNQLGGGSGGYQPPPGAVPPGGGQQGFGAPPPQSGGFGAPAAPSQGSWGQPAPQQDQGGGWGQPAPPQPPQQGGWGDQGGQQSPPGWG